MSDCAACTKLREEVETLRWRLDKVIEQHDLAEQDIAHKRRQIAALKQQLNDKRETTDPGQDVRDIFDYWVIACRKDPKRTLLNAKRQQAIRKALQEGYSVYDIQRAVMGLSRDPFRKGAMVYDDIGIACRNVELYRDKADAAEAADEAARKNVGEEARKFLVEKCGRHYSRPELPALWSGGFEYFAHLLKLNGCKITGGYGNKFSAQCPAHDDRSPSLSVTELDDGRVLAHCHAGCTWEAVCAALGVEARIFGPRDHPVYGKPTDNGQQISFGEAA